VLLFPAQALSPHQTGAAAFARARAHHPQVLDNARRPIAASAGLVGLPDLPGEGRVFALPGARPLPASVIIAAGRDAQQLAYPSTRISMSTESRQSQLMSRKPYVLLI
jgi:hypothetical protein